MSTPTFAGKVEIAPTATCNSCRGPDVCIIAKPRFHRNQISKRDLAFSQQLNSLTWAEEQSNPNLPIDPLDFVTRRNAGIVLW
jgi:hypothetical protein